MRTRRISFVTGLTIISLSVAFAVWAALWVSEQRAMAAQDQDTGKALTRLEQKLDRSAKDIVIVGDRKGQLLDEFSAGKLKSDGYKSVLDFASSRGKEDKCKKISPKCLKCPSGKIYCTNATAFLGE